MNRVLILEIPDENTARPSSNSHLVHQVDHGHPVIATTSGCRIEGIERFGQ